jgi:hypothetical protein
MTPAGSTLCERTPLGRYVLALGRREGHETIEAVARACAIGYPTLHRVLSVGRGRSSTLRRIAVGLGCELLALEALAAQWRET